MGDGQHEALQQFRKEEAFPLIRRYGNNLNIEIASLAAYELVLINDSEAFNLIGEMLQHRANKDTYQPFYRLFEKLKKNGAEKAKAVLRYNPCEYAK